MNTMLQDELRQENIISGFPGSDWYVLDLFGLVCIGFLGLYLKLNTYPIHTLCVLNSYYICIVFVCCIVLVLCIDLYCVYSHPHQITCISLYLHVLRIGLYVYVLHVFVSMARIRVYLDWCVLRRCIVCIACMYRYCWY